MAFEGVLRGRHHPGRQTLDRGGDLGDVCGGRATAAADNVDHARRGELVEQTGVRVAGDIGVGEPGQLGHVRGGAEPRPHEPNRSKI